MTALSCKEIEMEAEWAGSARCYEEGMLVGCTMNILKVREKERKKYFVVWKVWRMVSDGAVMHFYSLLECIVRNL